MIAVAIKQNRIIPKRKIKSPTNGSIGMTIYWPPKIIETT